MPKRARTSLISSSRRALPLIVRAPFSRQQFPKPFQVLSSLPAGLPARHRDTNEEGRMREDEEREDEVSGTAATPRADHDRKQLDERRQQEHPGKERIAAGRWMHPAVRHRRGFPCGERGR